MAARSVRKYLTYAEVNDHLPDGMVDTDQVEDIIATINDMGITVHEAAPDADTLILSDNSSNVSNHRPGSHVHARDGYG